jgi:hypothetical protein
MRSADWYQGLSIRPSSIVALLGLALVIGSCRSSDLLGPTPNEMQRVKTTITGTVVDESGMPIAGATIRAHGQSATTDNFGFFFMQNVPAPKDRCVAMASHDGYFVAAKADEPQENGQTQLKLILMSHGLCTTVSGTNGGTVNLASISGNASLKFEQNGIVNSSGVAFNGDAQVAVRYLDPADPKFAYFFAGDQAATRQNGDRTYVFSYGVLRVDMHSSSGEQLQPAPGKPAELIYPIPASKQANAPATLPLWFFDEANGIWTEAGVATRQGNNYVGTAAHFSDWTCAVPSGHATLSGIVTCNGSPVMGLWVRVGQSYALTNEEGNYRKHIPAGVEHEVVIDADVNHGMFYSNSSKVGPFSELERSTLNVELTSSCPSTITGRLTDDKHQPLPGRLAYVTKLGDVIVSSSYDGKFEMHVPTNTSITLEGMSWVCANTSSFAISTGAEGEVVDVGDLELCGLGNPAIGDIDVSTFEGRVLATLSPDGSRMGIMGRDPMMVFRRGDDGTLIGDIPIAVAAQDRLLPPRLSPDGSFVLIEGADDGMGPVRVYESGSGALIREFEMLRSAFIMPDGKSVIGVKWELLGDVSELQQFSIETGEVIKTYSLDDAQVGEFSIMDITTDGKRAVISTMSTLMVFDLVNDVIMTEVPSAITGSSPASISDRSISSDGSKLTTILWVDNVPRVQVIETATGVILYSVDVNDISWFGGMLMHPNGKWLLVQKAKLGAIQPPPAFVDVVTGEVVRELTTDGTPGIFYRYSFSSDGSRLIGLYLNEDKTRTKIRTWNF